MPVDDVDLAVLLADADGRLGHHDGSGRLGAALLDGPILHLSSQPGGRVPLQTVQSAEQLLEALVDPPGMIAARRRGAAPRPRPGRARSPTCWSPSTSRAGAGA